MAWCRVAHVPVGDSDQEKDSLYLDMLEEVRRHLFLDYPSPGPYAEVHSIAGQVVHTSPDHMMQARSIVERWEVEHSNPGCCSLDYYSLGGHFACRNNLDLTLAGGIVVVVSAGV